MSTVERVFAIKGHSGEASLVAAGVVSLERHYTFFRIEFPPGMDCTKIRCRSGQLLLVAKWQGDDRLDWVYAEIERKPKRLDEDPSCDRCRS